MTTYWLWHAVAAICLSLPHTALAGPDDPAGPARPTVRAGSAVPDSERERAASHFNTAMEQYRGHRYREAIREFELALSLLPSADMHWNLARAHEQLGESGRAAEHYRLYLRDRVDAPDAREVAAKIERLLVQAEATDPGQHPQELGMLAIDAVDPRMLVLLDGKQLASPVADQLLAVSPGRHRLEVTQSGYVPFVAEITVDAGTLAAGHVEMVPMNRPLAHGSTDGWAWATASLSAALLIGSGVFGLVALGDRDRGDFTAARRWAVASDLSLGGALCSALGATLLFLSSDHVTATGQERR